MGSATFNHIKEHLFFYIFLCVYIVLVLAWYYKPPWFIDHLIYLHLATPVNLVDLDFWHNSGVSVNPGHHNERWAVLIPLMVFEKFLFFLTPGETSQVLIFSVYLAIFLILYRVLRLNNGSLAANLFVVFFVIANHHTKNRATEVLADPFGVLFFVLALYVLSRYKSHLNFNHFFIVGALLTMSVFTKIHYGVFVILFLIWFRKDLSVIYKPLILGSISSILLMDVILFIFMPFDIFMQVNKNTFSVIVGYITGGLGVSDGPGNNGWSYEWLKLSAQNKFLPFVFLISSALIASRGLKHETILAWSSVTFFILIILLSSFSNFPANSSYAFPVFIFSTAAVAVLIAEFKPSSIKENNFVLLFVLSLSISLYFIYELGSVRSNKFFTSFQSISIILAFVVFPMLAVQKKRVIVLYCTLLIIASDTFWHNWKNIENHSWWRNGYDWHYDYLDVVEEFELQGGVYQVHFRDWPRIKKRAVRETMYIEPGIRSVTRSTLDIYPKVGAGELNILANADYLLLDYYIDNENYKLIKSKNFKTFPDKKSHILNLYVAK